MHGGITAAEARRRFAEQNRKDLVEFEAQIDRYIGQIESAIGQGASHNVQRCHTTTLRASFLPIDCEQFQEAQLPASLKKLAAYFRERGFAVMFSAHAGNDALQIVVSWK